MVLRGTHESAGPEGMVRTNVNVLRVNSIHALRGSLSRRSEISPMDVCLCRVGTTRYLVLDCEGFPDFACFFVLDTGSCLGHNMIIGADFAVLRILLTFVTLLRVGMKGPGLGWGSAGGVAWTKGTRPMTTWFHTGPRLSCSADRSARFIFGVAGGLGSSPRYCVQVAST